MSITRFDHEAFENKQFPPRPARGGNSHPVWGVPSSQPDTHIDDRGNIQILKSTTLSTYTVGEGDACTQGVDTGMLIRLNGKSTTHCQVLLSHKS